MFKWVSVTFNVQTLRREGRLVEPISLVCRALVTARNQRNTNQSTLPRRKIQSLPLSVEATIFVPIQSLGVAMAIRENTFLPVDVRRIYTPPAPLAGRGGGTEAGPGRGGLSDHEPSIAAIPIESASETTQ